MFDEGCHRPSSDNADPSVLSRQQMVSSISMIVFPYTLRRAVNVLNDCALAKEAVRFDELFVGSPMIVKSCWTMERLRAERSVRRRTPQNPERPFVSGPAFPIHWGGVLISPVAQWVRSKNSYPRARRVLDQRK